MDNTLQGNPILSEFGRRIQEFLSNPKSKSILGVISFLAAALTITLGNYAGANCIGFQLGNSKEQSSILVTGYLAELNHGLFYLVMVPMFLVVTLYFFQRYFNGFQQIYAGDRLKWRTDENEIQNFDQNKFRKRNRKIFLPILTIVLSASVVFVLGKEVLVYDKAHFGWVQTRFASDWKVGISLAALGASSVPDRVAKELGVSRDSVSDVVINGQAGGSHTGIERFFSIPFLIFGLATAVVFVAFALWVAAKIVFVLAWIHSGVRRNVLTNNEGHVIMLEFYDTEKRLGLKSFDLVYNLSMFLALIGGLVLLAKLTQTYEKDSVDQFLSLNYLLLWTVIWVVWIVIVLVPAKLLYSSTLDAKSNEITRIEERIAVETDNAELQRLRKERQQVREQSPWPRGDKLFYFLLSMTLSILIATTLAGIGIEFEFSKGYVKEFLGIMRQVPRAICSDII